MKADIRQFFQDYVDAFNRAIVKLRVHLIWSTKYRVECLEPAWRPALFGEFESIATRERGHIICSGGVRDHVHLLAEFPADLAISSFAQRLKTWSSHWIREHIAGLDRFHWQQGYGAFTVHHARLDRLIRYIQNQPQHHNEQ